MTKVLHIVESIDRGAVENWLVRMLRHARSRAAADVDWTFYTTFGQAGSNESIVHALGARVMNSPRPLGNKLEFMRSLRIELHREKYDVVHCHHDLVSAVYLLAATGLSIGRRIVHVHNADEAVLTPSSIKGFLYREPARQVCLATADRIVGISNHTLDTFLAGRPRRLGRDIVHYYGVDPAPFEATKPDRTEFRRELGLPANALILLFAGRIVPEKNPTFAVDVLAAIQRIQPRTVAVFAGAGSEEGAVRSRARELGIENSIRMLGWRGDLAEVMNCSDWFILPRPERPIEGFGLAVVEAQLAGLRMLLSHGIADDPLLPTASFCRLALSSGPELWAHAAVELMSEPAASLAQVRAAFAASPFAMDRALIDLMSLYR